MEEEGEEEEEGETPVMRKVLRIVLEGSNWMVSEVGVACGMMGVWHVV